MKKKKVDLFTKVLLLLGSIFCFSVLGYLGYLGYSIYSTWDTIYEERTADDDPIKYIGVDEFNPDINDPDAPKGVSDKGTSRPFTILLLGVDTDDVKVGRTDTIILTTIDPKTKEINMVSIPRDARVYDVKRDTYGKINEAYAYNGISGTKASVENLFDITVDYYMVVNFKSVQQFVDILGGLEIDVEKDLAFNDRLTGERFSLSKGIQHLDGEQALNYARFRGDAEGDFGRMRRQQQVIREMVNQSIDFRTSTKIKDILSVLEKNVRTDISFSNMVTLVTQFDNITGDNMKTLSIKAKPEMINGTSYVTIPDEELSQVKTNLHKILKINE